MKPTLPQGTRDFTAPVIRKRNHIFSIIKTTFELYGFEPLETPAMENLDTLMGKYGEEGDKLIFKILNNGLDNPAKHQQAQIDFEKALEGKSVKGITERALRYDLTIPFARFVAQNHAQLTLPFKRYQVQPVWRADRPQKGRYREFYQCDADIVGSNSLLNEIELAGLYSTVFSKLNIPVEIHINNRKLLAGLAELCGGLAKLVDITIAIDKLDKIGIEKVRQELSGKDVTADQIAIIENYLGIGGSNHQKIEAAEKLFSENATATKGLEELNQIIEFLPASIAGNIVVDFTLARGLNYYTGCIFEVKAKEVKIGSIGGGGRYDDLTGTFDVPGIPGVGISFGVDRIYDVMEELNLFPGEVQSSTDVLFFNLGRPESKKALELITDLREGQVSCEIYHENLKFDKQFKYANKKNIPFVAIIGSKELSEGTCILKNIRTGEQKELKQAEVVRYLIKQFIN